MLVYLKIYQQIIEQCKHPWLTDVDLVKTGKYLSTLRSDKTYEFNHNNYWLDTILNFDILENYVAMTRYLGIYIKKHNRGLCIRIPMKKLFTILETYEKQKKFFDALSGAPYYVEW